MSRSPASAVGDKALVHHVPIPHPALVGGVQGGVCVDDSLHQLSHRNVGYLAYLESYDELLIGSGFFAFTGMEKNQYEQKGVPLHDAYILSGLLQKYNQLTGHKSVLDKFGVFLLLYNISINLIVYMKVVMDYILKQAAVSIPGLSSIGIILLVYNIQAGKIW